MKHLSLWLSFALWLVMGATAWAETYQAGAHYTVVQSPISTSAPGKIEVVEFFDYGSGHSFLLQPQIQTWQQSLADDVVFRKVPAQWTPQMQSRARMFYTAEALNLGDLNNAIFAAMHRDRKQLIADGEVADFFINHGADQTSIRGARSSFAVSAQLNKAASLVRSAGIRGVPAMMVNGKYLVSPTSTISHPVMLQIVDFLINKERNAQ